MKSKNLLALITLSLAASGCFEVQDSNLVDQSAIAQDYWVTYSESQRLLSSTAIFKATSQGPTQTLDLESPSNVTFDGESTQKMALLGISYSTDKKIGFTPNHHWVFTDIHQQTYTNSATIVPIEISDSSVSLSLSRDGAISFSGEGATDSDLISITITLKQAHDSERSYQIHGVTDQNVLTISADSLRESEVPVGSGTLTISRSRKTSLQNDTSAGGSVTAAFSSHSVPVRIVK